MNINQTNSDKQVTVILADYSNVQHGKDIVGLLSAYALDPMGGAQGLTPYVKQNLVSELAKRPYAFSLISYVDGKAAGLINCFEGFSTFSCKPLVNIHDVVVLNKYRGLGISQLMLDKVEELARDKGCCKLTLEVLEGNTTARKAYKKFGFEQYQLDPATGSALFWQKNIEQV